MRKLPLSMVCAGLLLAASPASAHKMKVFASASGVEIDGYAYFSPGGRVQQGKVTITAPDGTVLATLTTTAEGEFQYQALRRIDHKITVDGEDGHIASTVIPAADLPPTLPAPSGSAALPPQGDASAILPPPSSSGQIDGDLKNYLDQSLARQIRPLREQLDAYQEKIWMHDVLGGLGVILGLGGLAFGLAERRKRRENIE